MSASGVGICRVFPIPTLDARDEGRVLLPSKAHDFDALRLVARGQRDNRTRHNRNAENNKEPGRKKRSEEFPEKTAHRKMGLGD